MYQYRNLPPRHQPPGFYPPHQPSLRNQFRESPNHESCLTHNSHSQSPPTIGSPPVHSASHHLHHSHHHNIPPRQQQQQINSGQPLQRSHSHGLIQRPSSHSYRAHHQIPSITTTTTASHMTSPPITPGHDQQQHHHLHAAHNVTSPANAATVSAEEAKVNDVDGAQIPNGPDALYAMHQLQRIKAATACQIINNRVVEAIRLQQQEQIQRKKLKKKFNPNWKDPNETNPNNPAYKGPENAKLVKMLSKKQKAAKKKKQKNTNFWFIT